MRCENRRAQGRGLRMHSDDDYEGEVSARAPRRGVRPPGHARGVGTHDAVHVARDEHAKLRVSAAALAANPRSKQPATTATTAAVGCGAVCGVE